MTSVSVVIPCFNAENWIARAISSVLNQSRISLDVIVVNDGSTDRSLDEISKFDGKIRFVSGPNSGGCAARNSGLAMSRTQFVMFLDADDYVEGDYFSDVLATMSSEQHDVLFTPWIRENSNGERVSFKHFAELPSPYEVFSRWFDYFAQPPCSIFWRRDLLSEIGGWDTRLRKNQDGDLVLRAMLKKPSIGFSDAGSGIYNAHLNSSVSKSRDIGSIRSEYDGILRVMDSSYGTEFESGLSGFGQKLYVVAQSAFVAGDAELGRRALSGSRRLGYRGHCGTLAHKVTSSLVGLENKTRFANWLRA